MAFYNSFETGNEPSIWVKFKYEKHELQFVASYENDKTERMIVDEPVKQLPWQSKLTMNDYTENQCICLVNPKIKADIIEKVGVLKETLYSEKAVRDAFRVIECYLWEKDLTSIKSVPNGEELWISNGRSTFRYRSNPAANTDIAATTSKKISNLVGAKPERAWLLSILWLLAELAVNQFGRQG